MLADISNRVPVIEEEWPRDLLQAYSCPQCIQPILHYFDPASIASCGVVSGAEGGVLVARLFQEAGGDGFSVQSACVGQLCASSQPAFLSDTLEHLSSSRTTPTSLLPPLPPFILIGSDAPVDPVMFMPYEPAAV